MGESTVELAGLEPGAAPRDVRNESRPARCPYRINLLKLL